VVGRTGENFGVEKRWKKKKKNRAGRMGFSSIQKTASTGSSATGALVGANSLQPGWTEEGWWDGPLFFHNLCVCVCVLFFSHTKG
jgi:hypothetical protein